MDEIKENEKYEEKDEDERKYSKKDEREESGEESKRETNLTRRRTKRKRKNSDGIEVEISRNDTTSNFINVHDPNTRTRQQNRLNPQSFYSSTNLQRSIHNTSHSSVPNPQFSNHQVPHQVSNHQVPNPQFPNHRVPNLQLSSSKVPNLQSNHQVRNTQVPQLTHPAIIQNSNQNQTVSNATISATYLLKIMLIIVYIMCFLIVVHDGGFNKGPVTTNVIILCFINFLLILIFMYNNCNNK